MSENVEIIKNVVDGIMQTKKWDKIAREDPQIAEAESKLNAIMEAVSAKVTKTVFDELENAVVFAENAYTDAAVLYGMHVAQLLQMTAANPSAYSAYVLSLMRGQEVQK